MKWCETPWEFPDFGGELYWAVLPDIMKQQYWLDVEELFGQHTPKKNSVDTIKFCGKIEV